MPGAGPRWLSVWFGLWFIRGNRLRIVRRILDESLATLLVGRRLLLARTPILEEVARNGDFDEVSKTCGLRLPFFSRAFDGELSIRGRTPRKPSVDRGLAVKRRDLLHCFEELHFAERLKSPALGRGSAPALGDWLVSLCFFVRYRLDSENFLQSSYRCRSDRQICAFCDLGASDVLPMMNT